MIKSTVIFLLLAITSIAIPINLEELSSLWSAWKIYYGKSYVKGEEAARFAIFIENYKKIIDFNSKHDNVKQAINKFADITSEEFKVLYANCHSENQESFPSPIHNNFNIELPASVDWRTKGAVGPVENQGNCGACWAFAGIGALEGLYFIDTGKLVSFSEQQLVDCVTGSQGCGGGTISSGLAYVAEYGIETAADYPYSGEEEKCQYDASKAIRVSSGFQWIEFKDTYALKAAIVKQPVPVAIEADQDVFQFYSSGVISGSCGAETDHGVLIVGYETTNGVEAFIVQNTWGSDWGENGYVYISTDQSANNGDGVCGILTGPVIPLK